MKLNKIVKRLSPEDQQKVKAFVEDLVVKSAVTEEEVRVELPPGTNPHFCRVRNGDLAIFARNTHDDNCIMCVVGGVRGTFVWQTPVAPERIVPGSIISIFDCIFDETVKGMSFLATASGEHNHLLNLHAGDSAIQPGCVIMTEGAVGVVAYLDDDGEPYIFTSRGGQYLRRDTPVRIIGGLTP